MNKCWLVVLLLLFAWGCSKPHPKAPEQIVEAAAKKPEKRGIVDRLNVPEWKKDKLRPIVKDVVASFADYESARLRLLDEALAQIRSGKLDRERMEPLANETITGFERAVPTLIRGLNRTHELLSKAERQALVDLYAGKDADLSEEDRKRAREERLTRVLDLSAGQKTRLYASWLELVVTHWGLVSRFQKNVQDARQRFVEDDFDAASLPLIVQLRFRELLEVAYEGLEASLPVLSDEQRSALSAYMDAHMRD